MTKVNVWTKIDDALLVSNGGYIATPKRHDLLVAREDHKRTVEKLDAAGAMLKISEQQVRELTQENVELRDYLRVATNHLLAYIDGVGDREQAMKWMKAMTADGILVDKETER